MKKSTLVVLTFIVAFAACNKSRGVDDQAMEALQSQDLSRSQFGADFWINQQKLNTSLWQRANAWCSAPEQRTSFNCQQLKRVPEAAEAKQFFAAPVPHVKSGPSPSWGINPPTTH